MNTTIQKIITPDERELNKKLAELANLEDELSRAELDLAILQAELRIFENHYRFAFDDHQYLVGDDSPLGHSKQVEWALSTVWWEQRHLRHRRSSRNTQSVRASHQYGRLRMI